jgi:hypothetical protein
MTHLRRRRLASFAAIALALAALAAFGCSLGLPSSVGQQDSGNPSGDSAGMDSGALRDGDASVAPMSDAPLASDAPLVVDAGACQTDADCKAAAAAGGACVTSATCDPTWHVCMLDVCGNGASCQAEICQTSSMTCTLPATYNFAPTSFTVQYGGVVPQGPQVSIAAAWPFVFVITNNGVVAYNVFDPTNPTPPLVLVDNIPFIPVAAVAVGRRIYFVNGSQGGGPAYREAIAWVDVPQNPFLTSFRATTAYVSTPNTSLVGALTNGLDGMFLLYGDGQHEPSVNAHPPFTDSTALTPFPCIGLPNGAGIVASTGTRLLAYRYDGSLQIPNFSLVNQAGTASVQTGTEEPFNAWDKVDNQYYFTTGADGSVLWQAAVLDVLDSGATDGIASARLAWVVDSATAANFDSTDYIDLADYSPLASGQVVGQPAWVDATTALGFVVPSSTNTTNTLVQIVKKGVTKLSVVPGVNAQVQLGYPPGSIGVAASNGLAYALQQSDPKNQTAQVQILAPACAGSD